MESIKGNLDSINEKDENVLAGAINMVSESTVGKSYECNLCKEGTPHMMVVLSKNGDMHVHAPFQNKYLMNQFIEAVISEQKKYNGVAKYENIK